MNNIVRQYNDELPSAKYDRTILRGLDELHWGQRKLLLSEIDFLTKYYDKFDDTQKYVLYIGASPGHHINYLIKMFPDIEYILYDKVDTGVDIKNNKNVTFHKKYFTNEEAERYKGMNIFVICDIRGLGLKYTKVSNKNVEKVADEIIYEDMIKQKEWCKIIEPKSALLKFRVSWNTPTTTYFDGELYFQIWSGNESIELRLVPDMNKIKMWDNKKIEEILFYYNTKTRRKPMKNAQCPCIGNYHESLAEMSILTDYIKKFQDTSHNKIGKFACDLSLSITMFLMRTSKNRVSEKFIKKVELAD